jgi:hypothetical protein
MILGGAVLQRCDSKLAFNTGFSRCGTVVAQGTVCLQPAEAQTQ